MKKYGVLLFYLILSYNFLLAKIIEISSIDELLDHVKEKESLVIFDIDNTLMEPVQQLGSDQWLDKRILHLISEMDGKQAFLKAYNEWYKIQTISDFKLVEKKTKAVFDLVKKSSDTIALTTRGFQSSYTTISALDSLGITFDDRPINETQLFFQNGAIGGIFPGVMFIKGILFTNNTHKGEALFKLLDLVGKKPKRVIFINDKLPHLKQLEESTEKRKIDFIGLRYGFTDERVKNIDPLLSKISDLQLKEMIKEMEKKALIKK